MDSIGQRLKDERKRLGFNQTEFASLGGVQKNAQSNYESDARRPDADYLAAVAKLGADLMYILTGDRCGDRLSPSEGLLLAGFRALGEQEQAGVLALVNGMQRAATPRTSMKIKGDVSQVVQGDMTVSSPMHFTIGKKPK